MASSIREELTRIIQTHVRDPGLGFLTVTGVEVTPDLRIARVWVSVLGEPEQDEASLEALERAGGFLRSSLARSLRMKRIPELRFRLDQSARKSSRIERLLHPEEPGPSDPSGKEPET